MAALETKTDTNKINANSLKKDYPWFYSNIYTILSKSLKEFFQADFQIRFMGVSVDENIFFYGDEYFVNKIDINKDAEFKVKISSNVIELLLDTALGESQEKFNLKTLTDLEAMLIKSMTSYTYKKIESNLNKTELNKKIIQNAKEVNFTFYVKNGKKHCGKIIITMPDYVLPEIKTPEIKENFSINDFKNSYVDMILGVGKSKITLNDIKAIEEGDIIVLENSDINKMSVIWDNNEVSFRINPNPSLIINIDNNGGNEMEEETSTKPQNMWDSILVDIVAEFDNVKLTLGELKQISEGLVIDVGSVYENKIKLRVENQVVATGELVILNDRYGVRIDSVNKAKETSKVEEKPKEEKVEEKEETPTEEAVEKETPQRPAGAAAPSRPMPPKRPATRPVPPARPRPAGAASRPAGAAQPRSAQANAQAAKAAAGEEKENFDYSDFEIEDESI